MGGRWNAVVAGVVVGAALILCAGCMQRVPEKGAPETKSAAATGTIIYVEGEVAVNGLPAQIGEKVDANATIKTEADGRCVITFGGENILQVLPGSLAVLNLSSIGRGVQVESGSVAAVLKRLAPTETGNRFQIDTPTAVAGIRGTALFVKVISPEESYVCVCNGSIALQDNTGANAQTLTAAHHSAVRFIRSGRVVEVERASLLYHTDAQMNALAKWIGHTIDWSKPDLVNYGVLTGRRALTEETVRTDREPARG